MAEHGLNIGNSLFPGFNDKQGLMLCGYEWGYSKADQEAEGERWTPKGVPHVFSNKALEYGDVAKEPPYDKRIIKWFSLWGHPLRQDGTGGDFEKCIVQTNWCNSQDHSMKGSYDQKLLAPDQVDNFVSHIRELEPRTILFFGSRILTIMQDASVLGRIEDVIGKKAGSPEFMIQPSFNGKHFKVGFQDFEYAQIACLPHPSGSHGLSDDYIALFSDRIGSLISGFKAFRKL